MSSLLPRAIAGLAVLVWWSPTLALAAGAVLADRLRFAAVMLLGRTLVAAGWPRAAVRLYGAEAARVERRARALAGRRTDA